MGHMGGRDAAAEKGQEIGNLPPHPRIHGGEIACLKGLQGGTGWPESDLFRSVGAPVTPDDG